MTIKPKKRINRFSPVPPSEVDRVVGHLKKQNKKLERLEGEISGIKSDIPKKLIRGEKGEKGDIGIAGENGENGFNGKDGKDGYTPIKNKDYFDGDDGKDGKNGEDGSPDTGKEIVTKINSLSTNDSELRIDASHIKNLAPRVKAFQDRETAFGSGGGGISISGKPFVTIGNDATLTSERSLVGTANQIIVTDNGANSTVTISTPQNIHSGASPTFAGATFTTMTAGSVFFAGTGGVLTQDNTNFFWNDASNFLRVPTIIGGTATTSDLTLQTTTGVGASGADMHFLVGNNGATEAMTILNSGNVGIGTSSPGYRLEVAQDADFPGDNNLAIFRRSTTDTVGAQFNMQKSRGTIASPTNVANGDVFGAFAFSGYSGGTWFNTGSINSTVDGTFTSGQRPPSMLQLYTNAANTPQAERMRITSAGDVGIGAAPTSGYILHLIRGETGNTLLRIENNNTDAANTPGIQIVKTNNATDEDIYDFVHLAGGQFAGRATNDAATAATSWLLVDRTGTTVDSVVFPNGNIGIGETVPDYKLDVNGTLGFTPGTSVTPADNGDVVIEATNNTTLTFKLKGSDGVVRSGTLTLA